MQGTPVLWATSLVRVPPLYAEARPLLESEDKKSTAPWVIAGIAVLLAVVLGGALVVSLWPSKSETANKQPNSNVSSGGEKRSNLACNTPLSAPVYDKWM